MPKRDLASPEGTTNFLAAGLAAKRARLAAGQRAVYQAMLPAFLRSPA